MRSIGVIFRKKRHSMQQTRRDAYRNKHATKVLANAMYYEANREYFSKYHESHREERKTAFIENYAASKTKRKGLEPCTIVPTELRRLHCLGPARPSVPSHPEGGTYGTPLVTKFLNTIDISTT